MPWRSRPKRGSGGAMSDAAQPIVAITNVDVSMGSSAILNRVSIRIHPGERVAVLGANGAGKSSLLRLMNALLDPSSGNVVAPAAAEQALIFQRPVLLKRSVRDNVVFALLARRTTADVANRVTDEALAACELAPLAHRYARTLSGGEQQKLALARAWALTPKLLLADEPTANLAPAAVHAVEMILRRMCEGGATIVLATHNRGQAKRLATRVIFMADGEIVEDVDAKTFFTSPKSAAAIAYLDA
ncbi:MAG: ABC transporter ATP-binding protein [Betaproteobacteria bacterium]|nr:MAG: ABC transporter ATP-binding protein [Betaproteobacteria bacterium]